MTRARPIMTTANPRLAGDSFLQCRVHLKPCEFLPLKVRFEASKPCTSYDPGPHPGAMNMSKREFSNDQKPKAATEGRLKSLGASPSAPSLIKQNGYSPTETEASRKCPHGWLAEKGKGGTGGLITGTVSEQRRAIPVFAACIFRWPVWCW